MTLITVYQCDACKKLVEDEMQVFYLNLKSVGERFEYDSYEHNQITLHFCASCARRLLESIERIVRRLESESSSRTNPDRRS